MARTWRLLSKTTGKTVAERLAIADGFWSRLVGLQFHRELAADAGLMLVPCNSVHTCFMRFPLDVVFLDRNGSVLAVRQNLRPWRLALGPRRSHAVVELAGGRGRLTARRGAPAGTRRGRRRTPHTRRLFARIGEVGKVCRPYNRYNRQSRWRRRYHRCVWTGRTANVNISREAWKYSLLLCRHGCAESGSRCEFARNAHVQCIRVFLGEKQCRTNLFA